MAALGTLTVRPTQPESPRPLTAITDYDIQRGRYLGALPVTGRAFQAARIAPLSGYVVRQLTVVFRQLWPTHGQRFPQ